MVSCDCEFFAKHFLRSQYVVVGLEQSSNTDSRTSTSQELASNCGQILGFRAAALSSYSKARSSMLFTVHDPAQVRDFRP
jgi:hypothetical protein